MAVWLVRGLGLIGAMLMGVLAFPATALADPAFASPPKPMPGMQVDRESGRCTAAFAAQGADGNYYLLTSGHCDAHDGATWTYGQDVPLGQIARSERDGNWRDAAIIRLEPGIGVPVGHVGGRYPVRDVLSLNQIQIGMPFCKIGAVTGETCGVVKGKGNGVVEASVYSLNGDSGSPGFVKNPDGTASAVGILADSPDGDDYTTYFTPVQPVLTQWGLRILS